MLDLPPLQLLLLLRLLLRLLLLQLLLGLGVILTPVVSLSSPQLVPRTAAGVAMAMALLVLSSVEASAW